MSSSADYEKEIEERIEEVRAEFVASMLGKQKQVVRKVGEILERVRTTDEARSGITEEIKAILADEVRRRLISVRTIEVNSKEEWKNPLQSARRKGKKQQVPDADLRPDYEPASVEAEPLLVTASGSSVETAPPEEEPSSSASSQPERRLLAHEPSSSAAEERQEPPSRQQVEFSLSVELEDMQEAMQRAYSGGESTIWIHGVVDLGGRVLSRWLGRGHDD